MAIWSEVLFTQCGQTLRLDAEFYAPDFLKYSEAVLKGDPLKKITTIMHPTEIKRVYDEKGIQILLAQNIRNNHLDFSREAFMSSSVKERLSRNILHYDDVVMTRTGANFGNAAVYKGLPKEVYACADVLIIRPRGVPGGYLATYFNTTVGRALLKRGAYGMAQPHIAPNYLYTMHLPRRADSFEQKIDNLINEAYLKEQLFRLLYSEAESILVHELGLDKLDVSTNINFSGMFQDVVKAHRLDAEYFLPKYKHAMKIIGGSGLKISDVASIAGCRFRPQEGKSFEYIEISNLGDGKAESETVMGENAPSRAQWIVHPGEVITSTVRPIRRLSALIEENQNGYVCSSGFVILKPRNIESEILLLYLRLPIICEILDLYTTASMYPAISEKDLINIPITLPDENILNDIIKKVKSAYQARSESKRLLEEAKNQVDVSIINEAEAHVSN